MTSSSSWPDLRRRLLLAAALLVVGLALGLTVPSAALALLLLGCYYLCLSACDWALHRFVLHHDSSPVQAWRLAHRTHHREFDGTVAYQTGASLTFPHSSTALIALATLPAALSASSLI